MLTALFLVACHEAKTITLEEEALIEDSATEVEEPAVVTNEAVGSQPEDPAATFFDPATIHAVTLSLPDDSRASLARDPYSYVPATATIDGEPFGAVGVRIRGKIGSLRTLDGKPKLRIDFNAYTPGGNLYGLKALSLNNSVVDCSYLKEPLGYRMFRDAGVPAPRTSWATVTIDGAPYGLYVVIETPDDTFLAANYAEPDGNFYDGKYVLYSDGSYQLLDFASGLDELYELEEGTDVAHADIHAISDALLASASGTIGGSFEAATADVLDWPSLHTYLAMEEIVGHNDGYSMNRNNYRVYFDPTDGKAEMVPYDLDYAFLYDYWWGLSWDAPAGMITALCWRDAACASAQTSAVERALDDMDIPALHTFLDEQAELIRDLSREDPRRECAISDVISYREFLHTWLDTQPDAIRARWGIR